MQTIPLGFEVGSGEPIAIPLRNLAVTGMTQESGKTTTLEALVSRAQLPAIAFVTKRGEGAFAEGRRLQPYFRDRADWQFVTSIIDATLQEKNKFLRPWIMKICRTTRTLADVQREIRTALRSAKGINEGVYTQLDAYLELIVPEIAHAPLAKTLALSPGLNVMDVSGYPAPMQMLFVQSAIDWVNEHEKHTITIVPEAWEMIPEGKGSPVKSSAIALVRKGSGIGNHIWVDSQDMAGVDKTILRGCGVWLIGVQREANEIKRNLLNIPASIRKPSPADIAHLERGQFYACWKDRTVKVYVRPIFISEPEARQIALGKSVPSRQALVDRLKKEVLVNEEEAQQLRDENRELHRKITVLEKQLADLQKRPAVESAPVSGNGASSKAVVTLDDEEGVFARFKTRLLQDPAVLRVIAIRPELQVEIQRRILETNGETLRGRIGLLIAKGFFLQPKPGTAIESELRRQGFACSRPNCYREADRLASEGFLTKEDGGYQAVEDMKIHVTEG